VIQVQLLAWNVGGCGFNPQPRKKKKEEKRRRKKKEERRGGGGGGKISSQFILIDTQLPNCTQSTIFTSSIKIRLKSKWPFIYAAYKNYSTKIKHTIFKNNIPLKRHPGLWTLQMVGS
jgi:hypothetical protein